MDLLKRIVARLPHRWQFELRRIRYARQIAQGTFDTPEPEYNLLSQWIKPGDWVLDIGANVGHYTKRLSELVGEHGRVIAFEPVPTTFHLLAANVQLFEHSNVTLINAAASDKLGIAGMSIPVFSTGLTNYFQASISGGLDPTVSVLSFPIDFLSLDMPIALIKIDAERHESFVLGGMKRLLEKCNPTLIVETDSDEVVASLSALGYRPEKLPGSPNVLFAPHRPNSD